MDNHLLEKAIQIATEAHRGQLDKGGTPYIQHPLAVMERLTTIEGKIVAVLHDVLEDTQVTTEDLRNEGFSDTIIQAILSVTRNDNETYKEFIYRAKRNPIGREVKIADLEENMDLSRIPNPSQQDIERVEKRYKKYYALLINNN